MGTPLIAICPGIGVDAQSIDDDFAQGVIADHETISLSKCSDSLVAEITTVWEECQFENWDGYSAAALSPLALYRAICFLQRVPSNIDQPEISATPTGEVTLDWDYGSRRSLTVLIGESPRLVWALLLGDEEVSGSASVFGGFPKSLHEALEKIIPNNKLA